jgi:hypothetical protein
MTEREHTTAKLARALSAIPGVPPDIIERATAGYYHDYLSPLDTPEIQLVADLRELADLPATPRGSRPMLRALVKGVINGDYDASKEEADQWAASREGRETIGAFTGQRTADFAAAALGTAALNGDAVKACADLTGRTGATSFECGYVHENVPSEQAGWYAAATFKGVRISVQDQTSPAQACHGLAVRLLSGGQCQHCGKLITLTPAGAMARDVTLTTGKTWTAAEQAKAGLCRWTRVGARWERGCA